MTRCLEIWILDLLAELDRSYIELAQRWARPLRDLGTRTGTFVIGGSDEQFERISQVLAGPVQMPWLFREAYPELDSARLLQIASAGMLLAAASVLLDHLVDRQTETSGAAILLQNTLHSHALSAFREAFPESAWFWTHFERLALTHHHGLALELAAQSNPTLFSDEGFRTMTCGKVAPMLVTVAALSEASGRHDLLGSVELCLEYLALATQLFDDIQDWQQDLEEQHLTYYLTRLAPPEVWLDGDWPAVETLQARIDADWVDVAQLRRVLNWLDLSAQRLRPLNCTDAVVYLEGWEKGAREHLNSCTARHLQRTVGAMIRQMQSGADSAGAPPGPDEIYSAP